jgi:predicted O-methyltransferase YrrM
MRKSYRTTSRSYLATANISRAQRIDGFISDDELYWLAGEAREHKTIIEVGSWHGRSSRSIADNMSNSSTLYCVDHWLGSGSERDTYHRSATFKDGDHAFITFADNLFDHIHSGRVIPLRMCSSNAAELLRKKRVKAGMVFIDAGHTYEEVKRDIDLWLPLVIEGGVICGHDYYHEENMWPEVQQAVDERFGHRGESMANLHSNSIWAHKVCRLLAPCAHHIFGQQLNGRRTHVGKFGQKPISESSGARNPS